MPNPPGLSGEPTCSPSLRVVSNTNNLSLITLLVFILAFTVVLGCPENEKAFLTCKWKGSVSRWMHYYHVATHASSPTTVGCRIIRLLIIIVFIICVMDYV